MIVPFFIQTTLTGCSFFSTFLESKEMKKISWTNFHIGKESLWLDKYSKAKTGYEIMHLFFFHLDSFTLHTKYRVLV